MICTKTFGRLVYISGITTQTEAMRKVSLGIKEIDVRLFTYVQRIQNW